MPGMAEIVEVFGRKWNVRWAKDWEVATEGGQPTLKLLVGRQPEVGKPRRPQQLAIADAGPFRKVTLEVELHPLGKSLILIYGWQDANHYNYAHISSDAARAVNVHNGMFHVFGGERVRISSLEGPGSFTGTDWTPVKLEFDGETGRCHVEVNGKRNSSLEAVDLSLRSGRVGLGSFNETGWYRNVRITGTAAD